MTEALTYCCCLGCFGMMTPVKERSKTRGATGSTIHGISVASKELTQEH